mgnify:FL=1
MASTKFNKEITIEETRDMLIKLKTPAMAGSFLKLATDPSCQNLTFVEAVYAMAAQELESRSEKRQERYLQRSGLREISVWNQVDIDKTIYTVERNLKERDLRRLLSCDWIYDANNVLISGATGTGKSWLLALLGKQACLSGYRTLYRGYRQLAELLSDAREHRETAQLRKQLNSYKLLIIDDFGGLNISDDLAADLLTVLEEREGTSSVAIASQDPFEAWHERLGSGKNADAIMDRLVNRSYRFMLGGTSLRERNKVEL